MAKTPFQIRDLAQANVRVSEGAGTTTLTQSDAPHQIFNLSAARTVLLPSTGILKGQSVIIENKGAFALTLQSSDADLLFTMEAGYWVGVALQDNPTDAAHWAFTTRSSGWIDVAYNAANFTASSGTWTVDVGDQTTYRYIIKDNSMTVTWNIGNTDISATPSFLRIAVPASQTAVGTHSEPLLLINNGGAEQVGRSFSATTVISLGRDLAGTNWSTTSSDNTRVVGSLTFEIQ